MNRKRHVIFTVFILLSITFGHGQQATVTSNLAEERIQVTASSATVLQWFDKIEKEGHLTLSYNASLIDLHQICQIQVSQSMTISQLLKKILKGYQFETQVLPSRKLVIQIKRALSFSLHGIVDEEDSKERLYGAIIILDNGKGKKWHTLSDANGHFALCAPEGNYQLSINYLGYQPYVRSILMDRKHDLHISMKPQLFEMEEVTVKSYKNRNELENLTPSNMLAFSGNDLFSQIWILPGVTGLPTGYNFQVDGGGYDENLLLLDGVPVYHPGHINSMLPVFNGDAVKNIIFHKGFFPTRLEGRLSSVTEINLKDGNKQEHVRTLSLDMPSASLTLEGPLIKDKLSYIVSGRRSWLDFFDNLLSEENRLNHSSYDYNAKLTYNLSPSSSLKLLAYHAQDNYHLPDDEGDQLTILKWNNQIYQATYNVLSGKLGNTTSVFYTTHSNRADAEALGFDSEGYIQSGIKSLNVSTEFTYNPENIYSARWGSKYMYETYNLATFGNTIRSRKEPIHQFSVFHDNLVRLHQKLNIQVGVHFIGYLPQNYRSYYSIQPRFSLKYQPDDKDLFYVHFSRMEQFYHYIRFSNLSLPTDFRMPSIEGYKPRSSEHYELGWKHFLSRGQVEISGYYKTRRNVVALRPEAFIEDDQWSNYIMEGDGDSYGIKGYFFNTWKRWTLQLSYAYTRSREWFDDLKEQGRLPSLYDIPHQIGGALSCQLTKRASVSLGGLVRSGKVTDLDQNFDPLPQEDFRKVREPMNYRVDASYTYKKEFRTGRLLLFRAGLYNIVGNPPEEEILNFYSVHWHRNCLPYGSISFKF